MSHEHMSLQIQQTHLLRAEVQRLRTNLEAESVARQQLQVFLKDSFIPIF
jgi:hypothetical protein